MRRPTDVGLLPEFAGVGMPVPEVPGVCEAVVPVSVLLRGDSPRTGVDEEHVLRLAALEVPLPPVLVRRVGMSVVDGWHRLLAALARGERTIRVEFFEGSEEEAFLRAVELNVAHGLPLSLADRRAAAARVIVSHPQMSDRAVAQASGLSAKAVAGIRRCSTDAEPQLNGRVGRDGRVRPLNAAEGRWRAAQLMAENPESSLRDIARGAGISPATVHDVRKRVRAGRPPADTRPPGGESEAGAAVPGQAGIRPLPPDWVPSVGLAGRPGPDRTGRQGQPHSGLALDKLRRDPSLRLRRDGRELLRLLQHSTLVGWPGLSAVVPRHCETLVAHLARQCAEQWLEFAKALEGREESERQRVTL